MFPLILDLLAPGLHKTLGEMCYQCSCQAFREQNPSYEKEQFHIPAKLFSGSERQNKLSCQELHAVVTRLLEVEELVYS